MYKQFGEMVVFMTATEMFIIVPGQKPKHALKEKNEMQYDILVKQPDIAKEEFEAKLKTKDADEATFELMYWAKK